MKPIRLKGHILIPVIHVPYSADNIIAEQMLVEVVNRINEEYDGVIRLYHWRGNIKEIDY